MSVKGKKLYLATAQIKPFEILFVSPISKTDEVRASDAIYYAEQEIKEGHSYTIEISLKEITNISDLPLHCRDNFVYDGNGSATQFLKDADTEYQEYLRLKAIYDK